MSWCYKFIRCVDRCAYLPISFNLILLTISVQTFNQFSSFNFWVFSVPLKPRLFLHKRIKRAHPFEVDFVVLAVLLRDEELSSASFNSQRDRLVRHYFSIGFEHHCSPLWSLFFLARTRLLLSDIRWRANPNKSRHCWLIRRLLTFPGLGFIFDSHKKPTQLSL